MARQSSEFWEKAVDARQELLEQYAADPNVTLIDIGYPPEAYEDADQVVLRIHVTEDWCEMSPDDRADFQTEVDGIPVCVICKAD
jgi:hypothetical protein